MKTKSGKSKPMPEAGHYYYTGDINVNPLFMRVIRIVELPYRQHNSKVYFVDSFESNKRGQWSFLTDWQNDLESGAIRPAPVTSAQRALGEIK